MIVGDKIFQEQVVNVFWRLTERGYITSHVTNFKPTLSPYITQCVDSSIQRIWLIKISLKQGHIFNEYVCHMTEIISRLRMLLLLYGFLHLIIIHQALRVWSRRCDAISDVPLTLKGTAGEGGGGETITGLVFNVNGIDIMGRYTNAA